MLIDIHSHFFRSPDHFSKDFMGQAKRAAGGGPGLKLDVLWEDYHSEAKECDWTVVFGGKAALAGLWVPDDEIVEYTKSHADKTIGFLSVDPTQPGWQDELQHGHQDLKLKGIKLMPMYAGFYPNDRKLDHLWEYATKNHLPVLLHTGTTFVSQAPLDCTFRASSTTWRFAFRTSKSSWRISRIPTSGECAVTIRKHPNVYADCSALYLQAIPALSLSHAGSGVSRVGKGALRQRLSFCDSRAEAWPACEGLNQMLEGTALPRLDMGQMEAMFRRNSLELLEIEFRLSCEQPHCTPNGILEALLSSGNKLTATRKRLPLISPQNKGLGRIDRDLNAEEFAQLGWNLLHEDLSLPVAVLDSEKLKHNLEWMRSLHRCLRRAACAAWQDHHGAEALRHADELMGHGESRWPRLTRHSSHGSTGFGAC
jgi:hypothetical protein